MRKVHCDLLRSATSRDITDAAFRHQVLNALTRRQKGESFAQAFARLYQEALMESDNERAELRELLRRSSKRNAPE